MKNVILDYVEPIYRFCLKRLSDRCEAEDLAQEILLCILESSQDKEIFDLNSYIWRIAHNRYARKIALRHKESIVCYGDELLYNVKDDKSVEDKMLFEVEYQEAFTALHSLSAMYRDVLVDYYVHDFSIRQIAVKHGVTEETVKWRLFTGKKRMKERLLTMNKTYEKVKMHIMCNGSFHPNKYLCNQIYKAVAVACYEKPVTVEEISLATGIPTLYLEEILNFMVDGDAIDKVGNKYQTDFIIVHDADNKKLQKEFMPIVSAIAQAVLSALKNVMTDIKAQHFYGSGFASEKLYYILIPELIRGACNQVKADCPELSPGIRPVRKDGGNGWFIVTEGIDYIDENFAGCNTYACDEPNVSRMIYYWLGNSFDEDLSDQLRNFNKHFAGIDLETGEYICDDEEAAAKLISVNLLKKESGKYYCTFPVLTRIQYDWLNSKLKHYYADIAPLLKDWMLFLKKEYEAFTPKRLKDQINGNVDSYGFNAAAFVMKELQLTGALPVPDPDVIFADNIMCVAK